MLFCGGGGGGAGGGCCGGGGWGGGGGVLWGWGGGGGGGAGGGVGGFAVGKVIGSSGEGLSELESVAVGAAARGGGVGRGLCAAVGGWCREGGAAALELEVRAGSAGAIALYSGLGFVVAGRRVGYYRSPAEDALLMRLDIR